MRVLARSSSGVRDSRFSRAPLELGRKPAREVLGGVDALVHAAYDFSHTDWSEIVRVNVAGTRQLLEAAREANVARVVQVSSVAAFPGTRSMYGRAKLEIEQIALEAGATVIRPGLVWGPHGAAMFGALQSSVARLPVVPLVAPPCGLALVHEDDLSLLVERLLERWPAGSARLFVAASEQTLTLRQLLRSLSPAEGRSPRLVRVPWLPVWLGLRALEMFGVKAPFRSDSLLSLVNADRTPFARASGSAEDYGVSFRGYA